ncbi:MAG: ABC transporter ATP-binding protein [Flavobacteriales bacterium]|nr:ABC transporter ATP-binding protein [Flavobacteriales bacterium]
MEARPVIEVEDLRKRYRLGVVGGATLSDDLSRFWARLRGLPDPLVPIGTEVDDQRVGEEFWALRGINFHVRQGETVGIIGRNGAGKSTLLKLLSRVTTPTGGVIRVKGRMASLLEVGTGFNPELTGRENIYLNGAILGMRRAEIDHKLEEIIAFSGIRHHIDTPTKRYSSGMKVRLGFAVAAHLEPEILVVDEVLAVGDAEFQKKCLGKMKDVAGSGRTILFVSHNMTAVQSLCQRAIWLHAGQVRMDGPADEVVRAYLGAHATDRADVSWEGQADAPGDEVVQLLYAAVHPAEGGHIIDRRTPFFVEVGFRTKEIPDGDLNIGIHVYNEQDVLAFASSWREADRTEGAIAAGDHVLRCEVPAPLLNEGMYRVTINVFRTARMRFQVEEALGFEVHPGEREGAWFGRKKGVFRPLLKWQLDPRDA